LDNIKQCFCGVHVCIVLNLQNMISTYAKDFCLENCPNLSNPSTFTSGLQPKLAKSSCGWLPIWLHHKIEKKNLDIKWGHLNATTSPNHCDWWIKSSHFVLQALLEIVIPCAYLQVWSEISCSLKVEITSQVLCVA